MGCAHYCLLVMVVDPGYPPMMAPPPHMGYGYPYFAPYPQYWVSQSAITHTYFVP